LSTLTEIWQAVERSTDPEVAAAFPAYLRRPPPLVLGPLRRAWFAILDGLAQAFVWLALRPRREPVGRLDAAEVDRVYRREAKDYDWKHHLTTRGQDTNWRRMAGWLVATAPEAAPTVLDLCTGTGLTVVEILRVLREHRKPARITGLDYNEAMLDQARRRFADRAAEDQDRPIAFVRGDATALLGATSAAFQSFERASIDIVTQVFGIGGIADPVAALQGVLGVLRENGRFLLIDMHRPIANLAGELPLLGAWLRMPGFEAHTYRATTLPLVLERLWGWRDTTLDFYLAPLICEETADGYYGLKLLWKYVESERWWLALPLMPTCRVLLQKTRLDRGEYERRRRILAAIGAGLG
jgi:ubiquinone/menaquinone biosynthesis C-methylase UbiE